MEINELRLGNWIECEDITWPNGGGGDAVREMVQFQIDKHQMIRILRGSDDFDFITLTEDWFRRFGFSVMKNIVTLPLNQTFTLVLMWNEKDSELSWVLDTTKHIVLKHVHTLQNIYFSLTGEELTAQQSQTSPYQSDRSK